MPSTSRRKTVAKLDSHLGYWLRMVSNAVSLGFARKVEAAGVTVAEWVLLRLLHDAGQLAPTQLAARMGMTKGGITRLADRLLEKQLVARQDNPADGRAHTLALTARGRALVPRLASLADHNDATFFGALATGERRDLQRILQKLTRLHGLAAPPTE